MAWTTVKDLRQQVVQLWDKGQLLSSMLDEERDFFPKRLVLKTPSSKELSERYAEVRQWIAALQSAQGLRLEMQTIRHKILGENSLPKAVWLDDLEQAVSLIGKKQATQQFAKLITLTREHQPVLLSWLKSQPLKALALFDEWPRLLTVIDWLQKNPQPGIYIRQADIRGVDTKFIERHRGVLISLLDISLASEHVNAACRGVSQFEARYGFLQKPVRVRFRLLDRNLRLVPGNHQDITLTKQDFSALAADESIQTQIDNIFITENEINFLAFPPVKNSLVLFGAGYGFEALAEANWLFDKKIYYWGDIDTHGFAILSQFRSHFPNAQSLLMDTETLLTHQEFWEQESHPEIKDLAHLNAEEQRLYNDLRDNRFAPQLRLEQEKIAFNWILQYLVNL